MGNLKHDQSRSKALSKGSSASQSVEHEVKILKKEEMVTWNLDARSSAPLSGDKGARSRPQAYIGDAQSYPANKTNGAHTPRATRRFPDGSHL